MENMFDSVRCMGETIEMSQPPMGPDKIGFRIRGSTSSSSMIDTLVQHFGTKRDYLPDPRRLTKAVRI